MSAENRIRELGITLRPASSPAANYCNAVRWGDLIFLAGKGPATSGEAPLSGKLGAEYSTEEGFQFARSAALDLIGVLRDELGSLDRVARIVELQGFINATDDFSAHAAVMDGASNLFAEVFGEKGVHARSVLGASSLRSGLPVILRAVVGVDGKEEL